MALDYLDFDYSEDEEGTGTFDAMASVRPAQVPTVLAEVTQVLQWAHAQCPDRCAPLEEGGDWQYDLQGTEASGAQLPLRVDPNEHTVATAGQALPDARATITLSISGTAAFCDALRAEFGVV